jgi:glucosylceramidase
MEQVSGYASKVRRAFQTKDSVSYGATSERASSDQETSRLLVELHPSHTDSNNNNNIIKERTHDPETSVMVLAGTYIRKHITSLIIVILTLIIFALAGENASSKGEAAQLVETKLTSTEIKWRPCQVYLDPTINPVKIVQTSLSDPASQWASMPCLVRSTKMEKETTYSKALQESQWSWLFGITQDESQNPLEYGMPSAQIHVDFDTVPYQNSQPILGFGGAFTEASALNYMSLHTDGKKAVMDLLYGKNGLGYAMGRTHINSCDFSVSSYSFDDTEDDFDLQHFDTKVEHDVTSGMIEMMIAAGNKLKKDWNNDTLQILASPWSPPAWMKRTTKVDPPGALHAVNMTGSSEPNCLRDGVGPHSKYAKAWALYFSKFLSAYKAWGIHLFAVTVQNEPEFPAPWEACAYNPQIEGEFIANHLGPILRQDHPDVKLLIFDHNKDHAITWGESILNETNPAANYVNGTAIHWYAGGMDRLLDGAVGEPNMHKYTSMLKDKQLDKDHLVLGSEACHCPSTGYAGGDIKVAWARAERYAHTVLADLAAGSNGWIEWNLILDAQGGPNHLGNMCDAPLLAVPYRVGGIHNVSQNPGFEHMDNPFGPIVGDGRTREELDAMGMPAEFIDKGIIVQPMYYYMGHISRYVRPGSRAVYSIVGETSSGPEQRTFRKNVGGTIVAGGGLNDLARPGVEINFFPCEGSTRQSFELSTMGQLIVYGHDWLGNPTKSCVGSENDDAIQGLTLTECNENAGAFVTVVNATDETVQFKLKNDEQEGDKECLAIRALAGNGGSLGPRGGAQLTLEYCSSYLSILKFNETTGEITSNLFAQYGGEVCATTGWPFLQIGSFIDSNGLNKTMVVLNEANDPANYIIRDGKGQVLLTNSIPAHSIQTVAY